MDRKRISRKEIKKLVLKNVDDCEKLADNYVKNWKPINKKWSTIEGAVYLRLSDNTQVAVERGSLEQQIHIAISEAQYRSEQEEMNYCITKFYIEPGITGTHDNRPEFIRLQQNIQLETHKFIIFKEISRLIRDLEIWKRFFKLCQNYDCEICIRGLPFNPNDPASILQLDQLAAYAEFESRTTSKRVKESNHSALITSGKFNGDFPLLGFDIVKNESGGGTGIYKPNLKELKQVEWIMKSFLLVDKYKTLLNWCKERNIKNKRGKDFTQPTIKTLLTNPRYIGKWYRNKQNREKRQNKLMPYDRYTEIKFNHGYVIDKDLWKRVQEKVKKMYESKTRGIKHCYPLSGLLMLKDGSHFVGSGAWGNTCKSTYYYNKANRIRVRTEIFEKETEKILKQFIEGSKEFQSSIVDYMNQKDDTVNILTEKINEINGQIKEMDLERKQFDKRLSFLLDGGHTEVNQDLKDEYKERYLDKKIKEQKLIKRRNQLQLFQKKLSNIQKVDFNKENFKNVTKTLDYIQKNDLISLKATYQDLFQKIIVQPQDESKIQLKFVFKEVPLTSSKDEDFYCISNRVAVLSGLEPETPCLEGRCSIHLSYRTVV